MNRALLPVRLNEVWLAFDASSVEEVVGSSIWVPIPQAPKALPGVVAWRGRAIAVMDLAVLLELGEGMGAGGLRARVVVVRAAGSSIAFPVDGVREVTEVGALRLEPLHASGRRFTSGEVDLEGHPVPILDLSAMVESVAPMRGAA